MAKTLKIKAQVRENKNPNVIRRSGFIPATVYGHGYKSKSIQINTMDFIKIPHKAYSHINELEIDDSESFPILIRQVQKDPVRDNYLNIEFYKIKSDEKIKVKVPLRYTGHSQAITAGGVLIVSLSEVEVQCLPKDIPDEIEVSLEQIQEIGQSIQIKDLKVSENIQILGREEEVVVKVEIAKTHEVEEAKPVVEVPVAEGEAQAPSAAAPEAQAKAKETTAEPKAPPSKGKEKEK